MKNVANVKVLPRPIPIANERRIDYVEKTKLADLISESKELSRILSASVITAKKKIGG